jgi:hypothetical protein
MFRRKMPSLNYLMSGEYAADRPLHVTDPVGNMATVGEPGIEANPYVGATGQTSSGRMTGVWDEVTSSLSYIGFATLAVIIVLLYLGYKLVK